MSKIIELHILLTAAIYGLIYVNLQITFTSDVGQYNIKVTALQMIVLFVWNPRPKDKISLEDLRLATGLSDSDLRSVLWVTMKLIKTNTRIYYIKSFDFKTIAQFCILVE